MKPFHLIVLETLFATASHVISADKPTTLSPFGIGSCYINNRTAHDNARWIPQMTAIGLAGHRTPPTDWGAVEPISGKWAWGRLVHGPG